MCYGLIKTVLELASLNIVSESEKKLVIQSLEWLVTHTKLYAA